jgi:tetratricopeptide (TPR) repeat protein
VLADFVCMGVKDDAAGKPVLERFGISNVPTVLFVDPAGTVVDVVPGYVPVQEFLKEVKRIRAGTDTIPALRSRAGATAADLALQLQLVRKLRAAGDQKGSTQVIADIVAKDPKQASEPAAEAMLLKITDETFRPEVAPQDYDLKPLRQFLDKQKNKRILFLGYDRMAAAEFRRGNIKAAAQHASRAWKSIPPDQVLAWGQNIAGKAYENWQALDKADKDLLKEALAISKRALEEVEKQHKAQPDNPFYGNALYLHAAVQLVNNLRKEAFVTMDKAIAIDPLNENLKKARDRWLDGSK